MYVRNHARQKKELQASGILSSQNCEIADSAFDDQLQTTMKNRDVALDLGGCMIDDA